MSHTFCTHPLWDVHDHLIRVAQGQEAADTVITHVTLVSTTTAELIEDVDIAISHGRIAYLGMNGNRADHCVGEKTVVVDGTGLFASPGFMDAHMHIESSMISPSEYARATVGHGTCAIFADPHEIGNVAGLEGVRALWKDAKRVPQKILLTPPSCVPAVTGVEDTGASIDSHDIADTMTWPETIGLGEMMNFPGILNGDEIPLAEVAETLKSGHVVTGHYTSTERDRGLNAYIAAGISSCHECSTFDDVLARLRLGMYVQLRYGSAWLNLPDYLPPLIESGVDTRLCLLCSDDNHPGTLVEDGHMDFILALCVKLGLDPVRAIQMATINTATYFGLAHDMGSITPGKCADLVLLKDLESFEVQATYIDGELVAQDGKPTFETELFSWPDALTHTMNLGFTPTADTFKFEAPDASAQTARVRVLKASGGSLLTEEMIAELPVRDGLIQADPSQDILKACVFDRHHGKEGTFAVGWISGFGIHGALAQTVSHDAHNLLVMGDNDADMALAAQTLIACGGGEVAVQDGEVKGLVELPVCGLLSTKRAQEVAAQVAHMQEVWKQMGCTMPSPFMTMGLLSLACIPHIRLTNRGYVNCITFEMEDVVVE